MRMDIKEAQIILECMATDMRMCSDGLSKKDPMEDVISKRLEALKLAQEALNYMNDRNTNCKRCKWLVEYNADSHWPVLCKKVKAGFPHKEPTVFGYFEDYEDVDQEDV